MWRNDKPNPKVPKGYLFTKVTSRAVLYTAWLDVQSRLLRSKDSSVRRDATAFASNPSRSIAQLQQKIRKGTFQFAPQIGVLKKRPSQIGVPPKAPRPIVIAPALNRIVQRAILNVCQSDDGSIQRHLGDLVKVLNCPTSVGGIPKRGVSDAIAQIDGAIKKGATWYVRSDLKNFFQAVPKPLIEKFLSRNISDAHFNSLFMDALKTELENEDEIRTLLQLFPLGDIGVPQGSALSALCANIALSEFDTALNARGITTIRYLDDFVILGKGKSSTERAFLNGQKILIKLGFECHDPFDQESKKASAGEICSGLEFLSFRISRGRISPSKSACDKFLADIDEAISVAKHAIAESENTPRRAQARYIQSLALIDSKIRGWGDAFRPTTERLIFFQLDEKIQEKLDRFKIWYRRRTEKCDQIQTRRLIGVALLRDTPLSTTDELQP